VKTGGVLANGNYSVTLESGATAFHDGIGVALDGDANGVAGGAYHNAFTIASSAPTVGIVDFMRGPGQPTNVPGNVTGAPIRMTNGGTFTNVTFELHFDPALLHVTGLTNPVGGTASVDLSTAGAAIVSVKFNSPVSGANLELTRLIADVPATATYGAKQLLDIRNIVVDAGAVSMRGDDGVQVVGFIGDDTFSATYTLLDVTRMQRVLVNLDTGFGEWPLIDPTIIGDTSGNGVLTASDATLLFREVSGIHQPQIPVLPGFTPSVPVGGPDPLVSVAHDVSATAGRDVTVPITLDTSAGLDSVQLKLAFDNNALELKNVRKGDLTADFDWLVDKSTPGVLRVDMARLSALAGGQGNLLELDFHVREGVASGSYRLDLQWASLNDGRLTLNPAPKVGADITDGWIRVQPLVMSNNASDERLLAAITLQPKASTVAAPASAPVIDWSGSAGKSDVGVVKVSATEPERKWSLDFVGNVGKSADELNPNQKIKVRLPASVATTKPLGSLKR
jgi:hypothetical protein